jgi:hypothetical protein
MQPDNVYIFQPSPEEDSLAQLKASITPNSLLTMVHEGGMPAHDIAGAASLYLLFLAIFTMIEKFIATVKMPKTTPTVLNEGTTKE